VTPPVGCSESIGEVGKPGDVNLPVITLLNVGGNYLRPSGVFRPVESIFATNGFGFFLAGLSTSSQEYGCNEKRDRSRFFHEGLSDQDATIVATPGGHDVGVTPSLCAIAPGMRAV